MNLKVYVHVAFLLVLICTIACRDSNEPQPVNSILSKVENEIGLTFPADSRVDQFVQYRSFIDPAWMAKVDIPVTSYESFSETLLTKPTDHGTIRNDRTDSTDWWKPVNILLTKQYLEGSQSLVRIVMSKDSDNKVSVYVHYMIF